MARQRKPSPIRFDRTLVLNQWVLSLFGLTGEGAFDQLAGVVRNTPEGTDGDNISHMFFALKAEFPVLPNLPVERLQEYDNNIVAHTDTINSKRAVRGEPIYWKYFQYLTLLFVEIYLDRYFTDPIQLRLDLNAAIQEHNERRTDDRVISPFDTTGEARTQLNKIALWNATGSGKTLLMHVNQLQYRRYERQSETTNPVNRVVLLTPNEGLSKQHIDEYSASGLLAARFDKDESGMFVGRGVDVIEVSKLAETSGVETVAVSAFGSNNLVFVDEGHRGASGDTWMRMRSALSRDGFSFEYSATFGQAVGDKPALAEQYSRSILFDYSYRWFYKDGFGKDHQILNLDADTEQQHRFTYLVGAVLSFYEQLKIFADHRESMLSFRIDKPLWVFVGSSVTKAGFSSKEGTDIVQVLRFLSEFTSNRARSEEAIESLLTDGLVGADQTDIFRGRFEHLAGMDSHDVFDDVLNRVFNARSTGTLHVENLSGIDGEIALRVGNSETPFGVINVGNDAALTKLCENEPRIDVGKRVFAQSLFHNINHADSAINLLIGSKKFTEGWNSWRVATMGLLNVGRSEGSQIIQLFGRGVRLRGYNGCLKRSSALDDPSIDVPSYVQVLETLNIFGVNADYMATFRTFLEDEGLDSDPEQILIPVRIDLGGHPLHTLGLQPDVDGATTKGGYAFRVKAPIVTLCLPSQVDDPVIRKKLMASVAVNWYPKIQARTSGPFEVDNESKLNSAQLEATQRAFLDRRALYADLEGFKSERGWHNVNISRSAIDDLLADKSWYTLKAPETIMSFNSTDNIGQWQRIAQALLRGYLDRFYKLAKQSFELPLIAYRHLTTEDKNLLGASTQQTDGWHYRTTTTDPAAASKLQDLRTKVAGTEPADDAWSFDGLAVLALGKHVYVPVLGTDRTSSVISIEPVALDSNEAEFARKLDQYATSRPLLADWDVKFMRNRSRGSGIGFYEGGNFYPDFVIWLTRGARQHVVFVDPKGMRNLGGAHHTKVEFHHEIKNIQDRLESSQPEIRLHSFLVSVTPEADLTELWNVTTEELHATGVVFLNDDEYLTKIFDTVLSDN